MVSGAEDADRRLPTHSTQEMAGWPLLTENLDSFDQDEKPQDQVIGPLLSPDFSGKYQLTTTLE
jgi:hypothetical protein